MKRKLKSTFIATALSAVLACSTMAVPANTANASIFSKVESTLFTAKNICGDYDPGSIIISFKDTSSLTALRSKTGLFRGIDWSNIEMLTGKTNSTYNENTEEPNLCLLKLKSLREEDLISVINKLLRLPQIKYAEPDYFCEIADDDIGIAEATNDPGYSKQYALDKIQASYAWEYSTGEDVVIGLIDTGVDYTHEDLAENMWTNPGEIPDDGIDNDNNGYIDDVYGWDFADNDNDPMDENNHGTHCAGIIAGVANNGKGGVGIAHKTKICALKVFDETGKGFVNSKAVKALQYAKNEGIYITSNSWVSGPYSLALHEMIKSSGLFIAAAGNDGRKVDFIHCYPSGYNCKNIIAVANTDSTDALRESSNYGAKTVDLAAPGTSIYSSIIGNKYGYMTGTSMATPYVSGAAALLKSYRSDMSAEEIKECILNSVDKVDGLEGKVLTGGRLNVGRMFEILAETSE